MSYVSPQKSDICNFRWVRTQMHRLVQEQTSAVAQSMWCTKTRKTRRGYHLSQQDKPVSCSIFPGCQQTKINWLHLAQTTQILDKSCHCFCQQVQCYLINTLRWTNYSEKKQVIVLLPCAFIYTSAILSYLAGFLQPIRAAHQLLSVLLLLLLTLVIYYTYLFC